MYHPRIFPQKTYTIRPVYFTEIVDSVLEEDDLNNDGYLTYTEYLIARHRAEYEQQRQEEDKNVHKVKTET